MKLRFSISVLLFLTALIAIGAWLSISEISDIQVSTKDFSKRVLTYRQWFGQPTGAMPTATEQQETLLSRYLVESGWAELSGDVTPTFITATRTYAPNDVRNGPAQLLYSKLYGAKPDDHWIVWSSHRQEVAKQLWPKLIALVNSGRIDEAAMLLGIAEDRTNNDIELSRLIDHF